MKLDNNTILGLAEHLENAELQARDVTMITGDHPDMDWDDAYAIQDEIRRRKEARGNKTVGLKAGLTSFAKMKQMGVETPVFGFVSDYMSVPDGGEVKTSELIHPKVEAEICIVTKAPLQGPGLPHRGGHGGDRLRRTGGRDHRLALPRLQVRPQERDRRQHLGVALRHRRSHA